MSKLKQFFSVKNIVSNQDFQTLNEESLLQVHNQLEIMLKDLLEYCDAIEVTVFAVGGTALGTVREKGFIPWDDDIDLGMFRKDYQKFISEYDKHPISKKYQLSAPSYNKSVNRFVQLFNKNTYVKTVYNQNSPEAQMLFIDIFPYDFVSDYNLINIFKSFGSDLLMFIASCVKFYDQYLGDKGKHIRKSGLGSSLNYYLRIIIGFLFSFFSYNKWFQIVDTFVANEKPSSRVTSAMGSKHYYGEIMSSDVFSSFRKGKFGNLELNLPGQVEEYLIMLYGENYMIPPQNKEAHGILEFRLIEED
ncbi:TPA: phosphorylcholine transferase LicD [Streptococcus suis]